MTSNANFTSTRILNLNLPVTTRIQTPIRRSRQSFSHTVCTLRSLAIGPVTSQGLGTHHAGLQLEVVSHKDRKPGKQPRRRLHSLSGKDSESERSGSFRGGRREVFGPVDPSALAGCWVLA